MAKNNNTSVVTNKYGTGVEIHGTIISLVQNQPAKIKTSEGTLQTSAVQHLVQYPDGVTWIQTKHRSYIIYPEK